MTEERTPNFPELKRLNLWVQAQDKLEPGERRWVQSGWVTLREDEPMCKTAFCLAGATLVRAGYTIKGKGRWDWDFYLNDEQIALADIPRLADEILGVHHGDEWYETEGEEVIYDENHEQIGCVNLYKENNSAADIDRKIRQIFKDHDQSYARTKAAPDKQLIVIEENQEEAS